MSEYPVTEQQVGYLRSYQKRLEAEQEAYAEALEVAQRRSAESMAAPVDVQQGSPWLSEHEVRRAYLEGQIDVDGLEAGVEQLLRSGRMPEFSD